MAFNDTLNDINLYTGFGLVIQTGTEALLEFPERKTTLEVDWREQNGTDYDLSLPVFKDKEVTLKCAIMANDDTAFWVQYYALRAELAKPNWQELYIADHNHSYDVFYKKSGNWDKKSKRLKNVPKVFVQFNLTLQIKHDL